MIVPVYVKWTISSKISISLGNKMMHPRTGIQYIYIHKSFYRGLRVQSFLHCKLNEKKKTKREQSGHLSKCAGQCAENAQHESTVESAITVVIITIQKYCSSRTPWDPEGAAAYRAVNCAHSGAQARETCQTFK